MEVLVTKSSSKHSQRVKRKMNWRRLRLSLKYRPEIMSVIVKMKKIIIRKNVLICKLKQQINALQNLKNYKDSFTQTDDTVNIISQTLNENDSRMDFETEKHTDSLLPIENSQDDKKSNVRSPEQLELNTKDSSTQTDELEGSALIIDAKIEQKGEKGWNIDIPDGEKEKSIADQVKEAAQSALQQSGMIYVESAGMYYDYKTGYYYNSELGLYYHTDTGCYYYYSDEKQTFVFHSYPDRRHAAAYSALQAHQNKKARKQKREMKNDDDLENLTKNFSQDKEEDETASKPKRKKISKKNKKDKVKKYSVVQNQALDQQNKPVIKQNEPAIEQKESTVELNEPDNFQKNSERNKEMDSKKDDIFLIEDETENIKTKTEETKKESLEDGECSKTDSEKSDSEVEDSDGSTSTATDDESVAKHHPPCMRVIVRETNLPKLKVGTLFLVTKDGGTVGREGEQHTIVLKDHNVSRNHLDIRYDVIRNIYLATDLGSKNGTVLNGMRMSESQIVSEPLEVLHGSTIQMGETKLLCHIHPGNDTCGHCEPGLLMESHDKEKTIAYTRTCSVQKQHQLELARLKNKYAPKPLAIEATEYNDRAQARREAVGSSHHAEKTQSTDVDTCIASENKGFKMLEKMGWSKGEGLGKDNQGETEPVPLVSNEGTTGLGAVTTNTPLLKKKNALGTATIRLANRSKLLKPPAKAFQMPQDEESDE